MDYNAQPAHLSGMQFRQPPDFYPAGAPAGKVASSATSRSGDGPFPSHIPHHSHQNSTQFHGMSLAGIAEQGYMAAPQHELYPAPPDILQQTRHATHHGSPQSWPPYEQGLAMNMASGMPSSFDSFPSASPYPPPRLSPPPTSFNIPTYNRSPRHGPLAGSLDPSTGVFYRTPDHPRLRTAQACEKCRTRKAKCSGEHPSCKRCISRGLQCEYAKEGRVRGPNKPKSKPIAVPSDDHQYTANSRNRSSSTNTSSSTGSSDYLDGPTTMVPMRDARADLAPQPPIGSFNGRRPSFSSGERRAGRPRPPNLGLEASDMPYPFDTPRGLPIRSSHRAQVDPYPRGNLSYPGLSTLHNFHPGIDNPTPTVDNSYHRLYTTAVEELAPLGDPGQEFRPGFALDQRCAVPAESHPHRHGHAQETFAPDIHPLSCSNTSETVEPTYSVPSYLDLPFEGVQPRPDVARYNCQAEYPIDIRTLQGGSDMSRESSDSTPTPNVTPTWIELGGASGEQARSRVDSSFAVPGSSSSSSFATDSSFRTSTSFGALPEHVGHQAHGLSMEQPMHGAQNMSRCRDASGDPHQAATGSGSASPLGADHIQTPCNLFPAHVMAYP